jgi:hypothetical protein
VPQSETVFTSNGDLVCGKCAPFVGVHEHVERLRHDRLGQYEASSVHAVAAQEHAALARIEARGPAKAQATTACSRCGNAVPTAKMTYALNGQLMCISCSATYDDRAERRKIEGSMATGFLLGFFLSVFGLIIVKFYRKKTAEQDGVWIGLIVGSIVIYIPLLFFLVGKLALA